MRFYGGNAAAINGAMRPFQSVEQMREKFPAPSPGRNEMPGNALARRPHFKDQSIRILS